MILGNCIALIAITCIVESWIWGLLELVLLSRQLNLRELWGWLNLLSLPIYHICWSIMMEVVEKLTWWVPLSCKHIVEWLIKCLSLIIVAMKCTLQWVRKVFLNLKEVAEITLIDLSLLMGVLRMIVTIIIHTINVHRIWIYWWMMRTYSIVDRILIIIRIWGRCQLCCNRWWGVRSHHVCTLSHRKTLKILTIVLLAWLHELTCSLWTIVHILLQLAWTVKGLVLREIVGVH